MFCASERFHALMRGIIKHGPTWTLRHTLGPEGGSIFTLPETSHSLSSPEKPVSHNPWGGGSALWNPMEMSTNVKKYFPWSLKWVLSPPLGRGSGPKSRQSIQKKTSHPSRGVGGFGQ